MDNTKGIGRPKQNDPSVKKGKNYFLGIGINDYTGGLAALYNAVRDVERFGQILKEKYDFEILYILTNEKATRSEILKQLRSLQKSLSQDDSLLIYYSGHGHLAPEDGYWIPVNANSEDIDHYIPNAQLRGLIRAIPTRHTLLIADACYSGSFFPESETKNLRGAADELEKYRSRWAFCSGRHDQKVSDGAVGTHSPFAEALITELERNTRPKMYIQELAIPVINRTAGKYRQTPKANLIFDCGDDGGQFVFALKNVVKKEQPYIPSQYPKPINKTIPKKFDFEPDMIFVEGGSFERHFSRIVKVPYGFLNFWIREERRFYTQKVTLSSYSIGKFPITQAQWKAVMGDNPSQHNINEKCPVDSVSRYQCLDFIEKLNEKTVKKYRLPTEAEWEFAARGGNQSNGFGYSGSKIIEEVAWFKENSEGKTHPVGLLKGNELEIYDMCGNVREWCQDEHEEFNAKPVVNPLVDGVLPISRVLRGGSFKDDKSDCSISFRLGRASYLRDYTGLRLAID